MFGEEADTIGESLTGEPFEAHVGIEETLVRVLLRANSSRVSAVDGSVSMGRRMKTQMEHPPKVQAIRSNGRKPRLYVSFPPVLAAAIGLAPGEDVQ